MAVIDITNDYWHIFSQTLLNTWASFMTKSSRQTLLSNWTWHQSWKLPGFINSCIHTNCRYGSWYKCKSMLIRNLYLLGGSWEGVQGTTISTLFFILLFPLNRNWPCHLHDYLVKKTHWSHWIYSNVIVLYYDIVLITTASKQSMHLVLTVHFFHLCPFIFTSEHLKFGQNNSCYV